MLGGILPIEIISGTDFTKTLQWKSNGVPVDVTGYTGRMQIRPDERSDMVLAELTTENGGIRFGGGDGMIYLLIPKTTTALLTTASATYDFHYVDTTLTEKRLFGGPVRIYRGVTR